jgi:hypothetical protein
MQQTRHRSWGVGACALHTWNQHRRARERRCSKRMLPALMRAPHTHAAHVAASHGLVQRARNLPGPQVYGLGSAKSRKANERVAKGIVPWHSHKSDCSAMISRTLRGSLPRRGRPTGGHLRSGARTRQGTLPHRLHRELPTRRCSVSFRVLQAKNALLRCRGRATQLRRVIQPI